MQRKIVVAANVQGRELRSPVEEIRETVNSSVDIPEGYRMEYGGQFESESRASQMLLITAIIAIFVVFLLLYLEFNNVKLLRSQ